MRRHLLAPCWGTGPIDLIGVCKVLSLGQVQGISFEEVICLCILCFDQLVDTLPEQVLCRHSASSPHSGYHMC